MLSNAQEYLNSYYSRKGIARIEACDNITVSRKCRAIQEGLKNPAVSDNLAELEIQLLQELGFSL